MEEEKVVKLFGVSILVGGRVVDDMEEEAMKKCSSTGNLNSCSAEIPSPAAGGHACCLSDSGLHPSRGRRRSQRGIPWTEEEHKAFLAGLEKLGKGDWRGISRKFVTTRTPAQVASHAQKYFLRQKQPSKLKRRSSVFDLAAAPVNSSSPLSSSPTLPFSSFNLTVRSSG